MTMTNAEQIQRIIDTATALRTKMECLYNELPNNPLLDEERRDMLKRGLKLKKEADFFTEDERKFFDEIDKADNEARQILSDLLKEKDQIEKAEKRESFYAESFRVLSLSQIMEENASDTEKVTAAITDLTELRSLATGIGWDRYDALLHKNYSRIMAEARAIVKELKAVKFVETAGFKLEVPSALLIKYETDSFTAESITALPDSPTKEAVIEVLESLLYHHRKALKESNYKTSQLDTLISSKSKELVESAEISIDEDTFTSLYTTSVETYTLTKDKVSNQLTKLVAGTNAVATESQRDRKKGKEITTYVTLDFDELEENGVKKIKNLDNMDRELLTAVVSVWESASLNNEVVNGEAVTTLQTLYKIITKNPNSKLDTPEKEKNLADRLMKLNSTNMTINADEEFGYYPALKGAKLERRGSLISVVIDRATVNGNTVYNAVRIIKLNRSPLYTYAKLKKQMTSIPLKQLDTKARNMNEETIILSGCLIRRIEQIKRNDRGQLIMNEIVIDKLLNEAGIEPDKYKNFKKKRSDVCKKIDQLLSGYVSTGYIKKYSIVAKGRKQYYKIVISI